MNKISMYDPNHEDSREFSLNEVFELIGADLRIHDGYVISDSQMNLKGAMAMPQLNENLELVGVHFTNTDGQKFTFGQNGHFAGRIKNQNLITNEIQMFLRLWEEASDYGVIFGEDLPFLADSVRSTNKYFRIATEKPIAGDYKRFCITLPDEITNASIERILSKNGLRKARLSDVQAEQIKWLWRDWLPLGKLTMFAGDGGAGKTNILLNIAATITMGGRFPDGSQCEAGDVLIYSTEDDPADTIKPRLIANGADASRVYFIQGVDDRGFDIDQGDLECLADDLKQGNYKLVIIDPIVSLIGGDMNKANTVRQYLEPLVNVAADHNCAIVAITHLAKGSKGAKLVDRTLGSGAFTQVARMAWSAIANYERDQDNIFLRSKTNIAVSDGAYPYRIEPCKINSDGLEIDTTKIVWGEYIEGDPMQLARETEIEPLDEESAQTKTQQVRDCVRVYLQVHGKSLAEDVKAHLKDELGRVSAGTLDKATKDLVVKSGGKGGERSYWDLKPQAKIEKSPNFSNSLQV